MAYENIIFDVVEGIATITFNRPKSLNALNGHLLDELSAALDEIDADEEAVIVGDGGVAPVEVAVEVGVDVGVGEVGEVAVDVRGD